jgi:hypothetical protein
VLAQTYRSPDLLRRPPQASTEVDAGTAPRRMSALHAYFAQRNQHAFHRALDGARAQPPAPGTSGGKSWTKTGTLSTAMAAPLDINARDWLGRTVLHLACAATDASAVEYVRMVLGYPGVNVNLQDKESMWTALHRALYHGNLASA